MGWFCAAMLTAMGGEAGPVLTNRYPTWSASAFAAWSSGPLQVSENCSLQFGRHHSAAGCVWPAGRAHAPELRHRGIYAGHAALERGFWVRHSWRFDPGSGGLVAQPARISAVPAMRCKRTLRLPCFRSRIHGSGANEIGAKLL